MSAKTPKSFEFCILDDDGEPDDLELHAGILDDPEISERAKAKEAESTPGPALSEKDDEDLSDLDDIDALLEESPEDEAE
jgi:hypothetical protein